jgi:hypothetical protein
MEDKDLEYSPSAPFIPLTEAEMEHYNILGNSLRRAAVIIINMNKVAASFSSNSLPEALSHLNTLAFPSASDDSNDTPTQAPSIFRAGTWLP